MFQTRQTKLPKPFRYLSLFMMLTLVGGVVFALWATNATPVQAVGPYTVDNAGDVGDSNTADGVCNDGGGNCTLRAAIEQANADGGTTTINFSGSFNLSPGSQMGITANMIIDGGANTIIIDGGSATRIFNVAAALTTVTFQNLTIQNGNSGANGGGIQTSSPVTISGSNILSNTATLDGGGLFATAGGSNFTINNNSLFRNNRAANCGAMTDNGGTTNATNAQFLNNQATNGGGAICSVNFTGNTVTVNNNQAVSNGGGIIVTGNLNLTSSQVNSNTSTSGHGGGFVLMEQLQLLIAVPLPTIRPKMGRLGPSTC